MYMLFSGSFNALFPHVIYDQLVNITIHKKYFTKMNTLLVNITIHKKYFTKMNTLEYRKKWIILHP